MAKFTLTIKNDGTFDDNGEWVEGDRHEVHNLTKKQADAMFDASLAAGPSKIHYLCIFNMGPTIPKMMRWAQNRYNASNNTRTFEEEAVNSLG